MLFFLLLSDIETISFFIRWMSSIVERFSINWQKTGWKWRKKKPFKKQNIFFHFVLLNEVQKHVSNKKNQRSMNWTRSGERIKSYNFPFQMAIYFVYLFSIMIFLFPYFFLYIIIEWPYSVTRQWLAHVGDADYNRLLACLHGQYRESKRNL